MTSVKLRISWTDENAIIEGVRIYKKTEAFDVNTRPLPLVELTNGEEFYEDFNVIPNETVYYMLSCFLGEEEVFTECHDVKVKIISKLVDINLSLLTWISKTGMNDRIRGGVALNNGNFVVSGYDTSGTNWSSLMIFNSNWSLVNSVHLSGRMTSFNILKGKHLYVRYIDKTEIYELNIENDLSMLTLVSSATNFITPDSVADRVIFITNSVCVVLQSNSFLIKLVEISANNLNSVLSVSNYNIEPILTLRTASSTITGITLSESGREMIVITGNYAVADSVRLHHFDLSIAFNLSTSVLRYQKDIPGDASAGFPLSFNENEKTFVLGGAGGAFNVFTYT